ncbi:hypothetical protein ES703_120580 [subsurface metagenome]
MKKVLCTSCGFLNWSVSDQRDDRGSVIRHTEIIDFWRKRLLNVQESGTSEDNEYQETYTASCLRQQWIFSKSAPENTEIRYASVKSLTSPRKCPYFVNYKPGYGPEEHKEIQGEAENRRTTFKATIIGAIIGALAAIVAQVIYAIVTK